MSKEANRQTRGSGERDALTTAWHSSEWQVISQWPMSGEDKLAWWYLYSLSNGRRELVTVTGAMIGAAQRTSGDAGRTRLKNLRDAGLLGVRDTNRQTGRWLLELYDPMEVARAIRRAGDPQQLFGFLDDLDDEPQFSSADDGRIAGRVAGEVGVESFGASPAEHGASSGGTSGVPTFEEPPEEPPEEPRRAEGVGGTSAEEPPRSLSSKPSRPSVSQEEIYPPSIFGNTFETSSLAPASRVIQGGGGSSGADRGTSGGTSDTGLARLERIVSMRRVEPERPPTAAEVMLAAKARYVPSPADEAQLIAERIARVKREVGCPKLRHATVHVLVVATVAGPVPWSDVLEVFEQLRQVRARGDLRVPASAYFVGARDRLFTRYGIPLPKERAKWKPQS
jgi:hypothetical protein